MGAGKTTVGRRLARRSGVRFLDLDAVFKKKTGKTPGAYFAKHGEKAFRKVESGLLLGVLKGWEADFRAGRGKGAVLATGGGVVLAAVNRRALLRAARWPTVEVRWLNPSWRVIWRRLLKERRKAGSRAARPLLWNAIDGRWKTEREVRAIWSTRRRFYRSAVGR